MCSYKKKYKKMNFIGKLMREKVYAPYLPPKRKRTMKRNLKSKKQAKLNGK